MRDLTMIERAALGMVAVNDQTENVQQQAAELRRRWLAELQTRMPTREIEVVRVMLQQAGAEAGSDRR